MVDVWFAPSIGTTRDAALQPLNSARARGVASRSRRRAPDTARSRRRTATPPSVVIASPLAGFAGAERLGLAHAPLRPLARERPAKREHARRPPRRLV